MSLRGASSPVLLRAVAYGMLLILAAGSGLAQPAPLTLKIEKTHHTIQGQHEYVSITLEGNPDGYAIGGFDLRLHYNDTALSLTNVLDGQVIADCGWEYFEYGTSDNPPCDGGNWGGIVHIIAIADVNNGQNHPSCYAEDPGELAVLDFLVTDDRDWECTFVPVGFLWCDCGDNMIADLSGDTLLVNRHIYDYDNPMDIAVNDTFPTVHGAPDECLAGDGVFFRAVDFFNGGVDILCADSIDGRGDVNLNGVGYEIADAVLFGHYFFHGLSVFTINLEAQIAATDCNADGLALQLTDLFYLLLVVSGEAIPFPAPPGPASSDTLLITQDMTAKTVTLDYPGQLGAVLLRFAGDLKPWNWGDDPERWFDGVHTHVLVDRIFWSDTIFEPDPFMTYTGEGTLIQAQATEDGISFLPIEIVFVSDPYCCQLRGNVDHDPAMAINIGDLIYLVSYLFSFGAPPPCFEEADINADGALDIVDLTYLVGFMFGGGPAPPSCPN